MRVGAGGRLDGALEPAVRNYVMSHSSDVYQNSYQTQRVRQDLQRIAFGVEMTGANGGLFHLLQRSSLQRDEGAPIYPTQSDLEAMEERKDIKALRAQYDLCRKAETRVGRDRISARIYNIRMELSRKNVQQRRKEYFELADRAHAEGRTVMAHHYISPFACGKSNIRLASEASEIIGEFLRHEIDMQNSTSSDNKPLEKRANLFPQLLTYFLVGGYPGL